MNGRNLGYVPALDGVRAFAVVGVLFAHSGLARTANAGTGVLIFFTLSGFLITSLLLQERAATGRVGLGAFYGLFALQWGV